MGLWPALNGKAHEWKVWRTVEIGTCKHWEELRIDLEQADVYLSAGATNVLRNTVLTPDRQVLNLAVVTVKELGFKDDAGTGELYERALNSGLKLCPAEAGFQLGLKGDVGENVFIAMQPMPNWEGGPVILEVGKGHLGQFLCIKSSNIFSYRCWYNHQRFVFVIDQ